MKLRKRDWLNIVCCGLLIALAIHELFLITTSMPNDWTCTDHWNLHGEGMSELVMLSVFLVMAMVNAGLQIVELAKRFNSL